MGTQDLHALLLSCQAQSTLPRLFGLFDLPVTSAVQIHEMCPGRVFEFIQEDFDVGWSWSLQKSQGRVLVWLVQ